MVAMTTPGSRIATGARAAAVMTVVGAALGGACGDDRAPPGADAAVTSQRYLCVFDYDLTLSSHACPTTDGDPTLACRTTTCATYGWHEQCLGVAARAAVAACVARGAYIGIASHADADACWTDKVTPMVDEQQFPAWTGPRRYDATDATWSYPRLDDRAQWNCPSCAYTMDGGVGKPEGIARVMRHYGLDPTRADDRAAVLFWDDEPANIAAVRAAMPEVTAIEVTRNGATGEAGGCGITEADIARGWAQAPPR